MNDNIKENLKDNSTWMRILYMAIFVFIFNIVELLIAALVIFQLLVLLFTGEKNMRLVGFGGMLSQYAYRMLQYLTFNSEDRPFPFADWDDVALETGKQ
ncbi:MAG: hypothetical protein BMS9Abin25_0211 [Gammaproteobacteria bacterium]|nr:MAG: hypothetical protein BMS9Abin25_0211 [Gammaproteobacteria bacterium]